MKRGRGQRGAGFIDKRFLMKHQRHCPEYNTISISHEVCSDFGRACRLVPLFKQEFTFTEDDVNNVQIPSVLSNIWGILNGESM
ncbi:hypothetical protein ACTXT7_006717 [Hymenolepis weldensis]